MEKETPYQILKRVHEEAVEQFHKDKGKSFLATLNSNQSRWINIIAENSEKQKGVLAVLVTSLTKKIETPSQDVRYHQDQLPGGYSGRTLDTKCVTPFIKKHFPRLAMKESGWLTRSLEQPYPYTLEYEGRIKNKRVRNAFLQILNDVEVNHADPEKYFVGLFILLVEQRSEIQTLISKKPVIPTKVSINLIIDHLKSHFFGRYRSYGASKLPVIALYSVYQIMVKELDRFQNKKLKALKSHLAADVRAGDIGDIEIIDEDDGFFEAAEIKHNKVITSVMVNDCYKKFKSTYVKRYYVLTTADPFIEEEQKRDVQRVVRKIKREHGCEVIVNGIMRSLGYYLRLIENPQQFVETYTENLKYEVSTGTEIKEEHLKAWLNAFSQEQTKLPDNKS